MENNNYKKTLLLLIINFAVGLSFAQTIINTPTVEDIWGGRINAITGYSKSSDTSVIYIATESANSLFYSNVYNPVGSGFTFGRFRVVPTASSSSNLGSGIQLLDVHKQSGTLFFVNNGLYSTSTTATSLTTIDAGNISAFKIKDSVLMYIKGTQLYFGIINSAGTYTASASSPISIGSSPSSPIVIDVNPITNYFYIAFGGTAPSVYLSTNYFYNIQATTTFSGLSLGVIPANTTWQAFGISPSGRLFWGGQLNVGFNSYKAFLYSDNGTAWTSVSTTVSGVTGSNISFAGTSTSYLTHFAKCYSTNQGTTWAEYGNVSYQTHPNDGAVFTDPNDSLTVYMTSDQGIAYSVNGGSFMHEMDRGVEAMQVNDFSMTSDKNTAWIASKAGVRKVSNYQTTKDWTRAKFPNGDGSPYYSAEMKMTDTNTVYVGNVRVYKTSDGGNNWTRKFSPEDAPYSWPQIAIRCEAIEICPYDSNIIFAGYYVQDSIKGGLFYSLDAGNTWSQKLLYASSGTNDVDVWDIIFNIEGADTIAYIGVEYDLTYPTGRSIYKLTKSGSSWAVSQDMNGATTSTGSLIVATIRDLHKNTAGDTIFACGTDAGVNNPVPYYKPVNATGKWTPYTQSGLTAVAGQPGYAITLGNDTVFIAVENNIYYKTSAATTWALGYSYPNGTQINFLYYDELLAGTETGLYGHRTFDGIPTSGFTLTVFMEGLYTSNRTMTAAPHNSNAALLATVADTITIELHQVSSPYSIITSIKALLNTSGIAVVNFPTNYNGNSYYLVVKHRNSLETWSSVPVMVSTSSSYDFSTAANKAYGSNLKNLGSGIYGIYTGDINQDGTIDFSDYPTLDIGAIHGTTGYLTPDLNGDDTIDFSEYPYIDLNSINGVSVTKP